MKGDRVMPTAAALLNLRSVPMEPSKSLSEKANQEVSDIAHDIA